MKGEIVNGRRASMVGGPDDPLAQLPAKERKAVAQLIVLRRKADAGDAAAQRIVEAVARLQIFVLPPDLASADRDSERQYMVHAPSFADPAKL